ncbi:MAG TPA: hypothetical protein VG347_12625 [Verrucomicrobiae bacterium]|nr:hypothetical protein [Verrucomicrobiae bacterium]
MNDKPKSKLRWRLLRWALIGLVALITFAALLVTEENWRTKRAWENFKRAAEAHGGHFDMASIIPPTVPDDQNFFCAPIVAETLKDSGGADSDPSGPQAYRLDLKIYRGDSESWPKNGGNWQKGELTDLVQWQRYFRNFAGTPEGKTNGFPVPAQPQTPAADTLLALSIFNPPLEELRQASLRPYARIPFDYGNDFGAAGELLPGLANMKRCAQFLQLRTIAELQDNQNTPALADIELLLRLNNCLREQPFLISHLVRIAMMAITLQPVYEGLAGHHWSDAQLAELELALSQQDYLADYEFAMRGELATAIDTCEKQRITGQIKYADEKGNVVTNSYGWAPAAFFYGSELAFVQMHQQFIVPIIDLTNRVASPAALRKGQAAIESEKKHYHYYKILALMSLSGVGPSVMKFARIQSELDLARVACALERYQLAHGNYPETLETLAPQFIAQVPHDLINGQPLHYRRTYDGKFILYSVGWDEKDDGGKVFLTAKGSVDQKKGDWVWQYPAP